MRNQLAVIIFASLLVSITSLGQKSKRIIHFTLLPSGSRPSIPEIVIEGALQEKLPLYNFKSFDQAPIILTKAEFEKSIVLYQPQEFPRWDSTKLYLTGERVRYNDTDYECALDSNRAVPGSGYEYWQETFVGKGMNMALSDLSTLGMDYLFQSAADLKLHYVHFYYADNYSGIKYVVSLEARHVVDLLNKTGLIWYGEPLGFLNHLAGDVYLLNQDDYDGRITKTLKQAIDTTKTKVADEQYRVLVTYKQTKIDQLFLYEYETHILDTIPKFDLSARTANHTMTFRLLGDAMADSKSHQFSNDPKSIKLKPLKNFPEAASASGKSIATLTCQVHEVFYLNMPFHQQVYDASFFKNVNAVSNTLFEGVSESQIKIYKPDLVSFYDPDELIVFWTKEQPIAYQPWSEAYTFYGGDRVSYNGWEYIALTDNMNKRPDLNPKDWRGKKIMPITFQPSDINGFKVTYQLTFSQTGIIKSKIPVSIELWAFDENMQVFRPIGYVKYGELLTYALKRKELSAFLQQWIETQTGLWAVQGNDPIKIAVDAK